MQPDYVGTVEPVARRSLLLAYALDRSNPQAEREVAG
jgi:hypothetical protein